MANDYSFLINSVTAKLTSDLSTYSIVISQQVFVLGNLPAFSNYAIIVSPGPQPWASIRKGTKTLQDTFKVNLYLLVKNFDDTNSLFGIVSPNKGLFELANDVKNSLRGATFSDFLVPTFDEVSEPMDFEFLASPGFESSERTFIHRALIKYIGYGQLYCPNP